MGKACPLNRHAPKVSGAVQSIKGRRRTMLEKETARSASSVSISSTRKHGTPGKVAFTVLVNNRSDNIATKGGITIYDADSGDATGVLFGAIPSGRSDGKTVQIAGLPEVVIVHFESGAPDAIWNGVMNGPNIPNPVIINLT